MDLSRLNFLQNSFLLGSVQCAERSDHPRKSIGVGVEVGEWYPKCLRQPLRSGYIGSVYALFVPIDACTSHKRIQSSKDTELFLRETGILTSLSQALAEDR